MPTYDIFQRVASKIRYCIIADNPAHAMAILQDGGCEARDDEMIDVLSENIICRETGDPCDDEAARMHEVTPHICDSSGKWRVLDNQGGEVPGEFDTEADAINAAVKASTWED